MKRWICLLLSLVMLLSVCVVGAAAQETVSHRVLTQVLGEGTVIPDQFEVKHGDSLRLYFYPEEGYEVTGVYMNGFPVTYALSLREHRQTCSGCDLCNWVNWEELDALLAGDDWSEWKQYVDLGNITADKLITVEFSSVKSEEKPTEPTVNPLAAYADLNPDAWYADAAAFVLENNLMTGSGGRFRPDDSTTRAMIVTVLWRMEGCPVASDDAPVFTDVTDLDSWYYGAVRWAAEQEIVNGYGETFAPQDPVTREQLAAILWRYAKYQGADVSVGENTNILSYEDAFEISDWAFAPLQWTCGTGILNGADGRLMPQGQATRIQTAAMLQRFLAK